MMTDELGYGTDASDPFRAATATLAAFSLVGFLPLAAFVFDAAAPGDVEAPFAWSAALTALSFLLTPGCGTLQLSIERGARRVMEWGRPLGESTRERRETTHARDAHGCQPTRPAVTITTSLFLIAIGAILKFAVTWRVVGIDLDVVGVILMVVGVVGLVLGLFLLLRDRETRPRPPSPY
jgi:hypothetical protein